MSEAAERAKFLLKHISRGPWHVVGEHGHGIDNINDETICYVENYPDVDFVAESRSLVPELLDEITRQQEEIDRLNNIIKQCAEVLTEGYYPEDISYDLQSVNWVHKELATNVPDKES